MATVTGLTAARMIAMENATVVSGSVNEDGDLILVTRDGTLINAGPVIGPEGPEGPEGSVDEAPEDTTRYVRKDGVWVNVNTAYPPVDGNTYVMRDKLWVLLNSELAPDDGYQYVMKDGLWQRIDRPWLLSASDGSLPTGFTVGTLATTDWSVKFSGAGHSVHYVIDCEVGGSDLSAATRFTFPPAIRPIMAEKAVLMAQEDASLSNSSAIGLGRINTDGTVLMPVETNMSMVTSDPPPDGGVKALAGGVSVKLTMSGSYHRSSLDLPTGAAYI